MNPRLLRYLRSLGLATDATDEQAWEFMQNLRGLQASIANCLNYAEVDARARTNCDLMIRALGHDPDNPTELLDSDDTHAGDDGQRTAADPVDPDMIRRETLESERRRVTSIRELAEMASVPDELIRELTDDPQITVDAARQRILSEHRQRTRARVSPDGPAGPAIHSRDRTPTVELLQAAMLHSRGLDPTTQWAEDHNGTPRWRRQTPDTERWADLGWEYRALSLEDVIRMCAEIDGVSLPRGRNGIMQAYANGLSGRSFSTAALSNVFTTNVNSELLAAFDAAPDSTTGGWVREADVRDFRTNERVRMLAGSALERLPRGSEAAHATYEDAKEEYSIARYARQFVIDDQDIQDDNFGGISGFVPADMGVAARQLRPDLVYSVLMANAAMRDSVALFHATHANLNTSSALAIATLSAARKGMKIQTENSRNLNIAMKFLIVPPALEDTAYTLISSELVVDGTATGLTPNRNPNFRANLEVVADARLENGITDPTDPTGATTHSGSATTWFGAAMANSHTIEVGYLRGSGRRPEVRSSILTQGKWGLAFDVKMDIGAKALDWRGLCKNTA